MDNQSNEKVLMVHNQIHELTRIEAFLEELGEQWDLPLPFIFSLNLAIEEALTNIISYGYTDKGDHPIELDFKKNGDDLTIIIQDDGLAYDPTLKADPDITLPAAERPVGGLGIFLIKKIMDKVEYQRKDEKNYLILTKKIAS
jgi:serine/threonine-protein kinase RsbW